MRNKEILKDYYEYLMWIIEYLIKVEKFTIKEIISRYRIHDINVTLNIMKKNNFHLSKIEKVRKKYSQHEELANTFDIEVSKLEKLNFKNILEYFQAYNVGVHNKFQSIKYWNSINNLEEGEYDVPLIKFDDNF